MCIFLLYKKVYVDLQNKFYKSKLLSTFYLCDLNYLLIKFIFLANQEM